MIAWPDQPDHRQYTPRTQMLRFTVEVGLQLEGVAWQIDIVTDTCCHTA